MKIQNIKKHIEYYFELFFPGYFTEQFIQTLPSKNDVIKFTIYEGQNELTWFTWLEEDKIHTICQHQKDSRCQYQLNSMTFLKIVQGELSPQTAFFTRQLKIKGDILYALRLGALLEQFFKQHPYLPERAGNETAK